LVTTNPTAIAGRLVHAFAGIARPGKFFTSLTAAGAVLARQTGFPDHHPYRRPALEALIRDADRAGALLVTTPKDAVRLPPDLRPHVTTIGVTLAWDQPEAIDRWLQSP
jgi:tetraacyldisaccharide 4'-kinase